VLYGGIWVVMVIYGALWLYIGLLSVLGSLSIYMLPTNAFFCMFYF
jgi:hypothetical protein